ncbi:hypothetical protein CsatB_006285 [Cannabis sativa]
MAAAIAIISGLCGVKYRKKSSSPSPSLSLSPSSSTKQENNEDIILDSPSPPHSSFFPFSHQDVELHENKAQDTSYNNRKEEASFHPKKVMRGTYSFKELKKTITAGSSSIKVRRSLSLIARGRPESQIKNEDTINSSSNDDTTKKKGKRKMDHQESIWMKTIILGEKCKVSDEEEEAVIYERKGKKISAYHPRTGSSLSISRQSSFINQDHTLVSCSSRS